MTEPTLKLLIVEDDSGLRSQLRWAFDEYEVLLAEDRAEAIKLSNSEMPAVVVLDLGLPPDPDGASEGLATLSEILQDRPATKVIIASGNEVRENAVRAISLGAYDFCAKPVEVEELRLIVQRAWHVHRLEEENRKLSRSISGTPFGGIITSDQKLVKICRGVEKVADTEVTVLITGESGTGKELMARAVHEVSARSDGPFVAINCAAIPENLLESELFGFERGAFTGAAKQTVGKIEMAHEGTLFLDEIGDLPLALQSKLLRFLEERVIERLGGRKQIPVDVRIVAATNQDLAKMMTAGTFREDLYYRLNEYPASIPPLRERRGDAVLLAKYFLSAFNEQYNKSIKGISQSGLAAIDKHSWPGNVRQLENHIKKAVIMSERKVLSATDCGLGKATNEDALPNLKDARESLERNLVERALASADGNLSKAAKLLGVSRPTFYDLMRNHGFRAD